MRALACVVLLACACAAPPLQPPPPPSPLASLEAARDLDDAPVGHVAGPTLVISLASWCEHCHAELAQLATLRAQHPELRILGVSYAPFEAYAQRGGPRELRAYLAANATWLRVVPVDDALFDALGHPSKVPALFVFDARGHLVATYDRAVRAPPTAIELDALIRTLD